MVTGEKEFRELAKSKGCILEWYNSKNTKFEAPQEVWLDCMFAFCGCTDKESMYDIVLRYMQKLSHKNNHNPEYYTDFIGEIFDDNETYFYFVANIVDNIGLAEHGTAIRGAWLSPAGEYALTLLENPKFLQVVEDYYN